MKKRNWMFLACVSSASGVSFYTEKLFWGARKRSEKPGEAKTHVQKQRIVICWLSFWGNICVPTPAQTLSLPPPIGLIHRMSLVHLISVILAVWPAHLHFLRLCDRTQNSSLAVSAIFSSRRVALVTHSTYVSFSFHTLSAAYDVELPWASVLDPWFLSMPSKRTTRTV